MNKNVDILKVQVNGCLSKRGTDSTMRLLEEPAPTESVLGIFKSLKDNLKVGYISVNCSGGRGYTSCIKESDHGDDQVCLASILMVIRCVHSVHPPL